MTLRYPESELLSHRPASPKLKRSLKKVTFSSYSAPQLRHLGLRSGRHVAIDRHIPGRANALPSFSDVNGRDTAEHAHMAPFGCIDDKDPVIGDELSVATVEK